MKLFEEMVDSGASLEARAERLTTPESLVDTEEQRVWQAQIAAQASALRAGRGAPQLLHRTAEAYLGVQKKSTGKTPRQRLRDVVGDRDDLIDLLLAGIEGTIARGDLPGCDDVVRLFDPEQGRLARAALRRRTAQPGAGRPALHWRP